MAARPLRLLQITDTHLFEDASAELYGLHTAESFEAALAQALAETGRGLDAILATGDIAEDGRRGTYERFRERLAPLGVPVLCLPGNHEDPGVMAEVLGSPPFQYCGSLRLGGWRIVMLDTHVPMKPGGWLDAGELARLERELAAASDENVLVCLHHQPIPMGSAWLDAVGLGNPEDFEAVLERHANVRGVAWGHVHQASDRAHRGIHMMSTPSTCAQFTPRTDRCLMDLAPPGYRWLELDPRGRIETRVRWVESWRRGERPPDTRQAE
jgi:3',5'-cyclic-AMP phosphodiesterase